MPDKRIIRPKARRSGNRDARLIIIASEGTKTERRYFEDLASAYWNSKIHVKVLERSNTTSDPDYVLSQLDKFKLDYRVKPGYDELWLVIDLDRWGARKLAKVCRQAIQKHYDVAVSNPCFEFWLLLHHRSLDEYSDVEQIKLLKNSKDGTTRTYLRRELARIIGKYNSDNLCTEDFIPYIHDAIERAQSIDKPEERWPNNLGSKVFRLALRIVDRAGTDVCSSS